MKGTEDNLVSVKICRVRLLEILSLLTYQIVRVMIREPW
jgi:hypothetical protein